MKKWTSLVLIYQKAVKQAVLNVSEDSALFCNVGLNRKLSVDGRILVMEELQKLGLSWPLDKAKQQWEVYWYPLSEWARLVYKYISDNGLNNTVCTVFEMIDGEDTMNEEFHGLERSVFLKILKSLQADNKCELFDGEEGVKFF